MKKEKYPRIKNEVDGNQVLDFHCISEAQVRSKLNDTKSEIGSGNGKGARPKECPKKSKVPDIKYLEKEVLKSIKGQDIQVRRIITAIYRAIKLRSIKSNVLIIGNSGTGKTAIIKEIAKYLNLPYTIEDATKYTQEGYYGADVKDMIYNLIEASDNNIERAKKGIIIVDEIDKKASSFDYHDVSGAEVLKSMLKIVEGTKLCIQNPDSSYLDEEMTIDFDTSNIIFIFLGAFSGIDEKREAKNVRLGFNSDTCDSNNPVGRILKKDLIAYGLPEEFVGRIDTIIEMNRLSKEDLTCILKNSRLSIFRKYEKQLKEQKIILEYDDDIFERIAERSLSYDTGARELSNTVNYIFENIIYQIIAYPRKYRVCKLLKGIENDNTKFKMI